MGKRRVGAVVNKGLEYVDYCLPQKLLEMATTLQYELSAPGNGVNALIVHWVVKASNVETAARQKDSRAPLVCVGLFKRTRSGQACDAQFTGNLFISTSVPLIGKRSPGGEMGRDGS